MSAPPRPRILDALGEELVRAAREYEANHDNKLGGARRGPFGRWTAGRGNPRSRSGGAAWRPVVIAVALLLLLAAIAVAATLVIGRGDPIPAPPAGAVPLELQPVAGTARLNGLDVADPDGGPAWDVRTSRSRSGAVCVTVGQVLDGTLGIVGLDRRFRALPAGAADTCSVPQPTGATVAAARELRGGGSGSAVHAVTVVDGVVAPGVRSAVAYAGTERRALKIGPDGAFLAVFAGVPEQLRPRVALTGAGGRTTVLRFADTGEYLAQDPSGGTPWTIRAVTGDAPAGRRCVVAQREAGPDSPPPLPPGGPLPTNVGSQPSVPIRCGLPGTAFLDVRRFVPRFTTRSRGSSWDLHPARTITWGAAPDARSVVTIAVAGGPARRVAVDPRSLGFLMVYDGQVDPAAVRVTVDGRVIAPRGAGVVDGDGRPVARLPIPPWRSVASAVAAIRLPGAFRAVASSVALPRTAADPTGGPRWALRAFTGRETSQRGKTTTYRCFQIGLPGPGGALREPLVGGGAGRALALTFTDAAQCTPTRASTAAPPAPVVRTSVRDPEAAEPHVARVVVAGQLGPGVRRATLTGLPGGPRRLKLGRGGTYLMVLGPEAAGRALRVRAGGAAVVSKAANAFLAPAACRLVPGAYATIADPDGAAPWVSGSSGTGARRCSFVGQLVDRRLAVVDQGDGTLRPGPYSYARGSRHLGQTGAAAHVDLEVEGTDDPATPGLKPATVSRAQIARRTLPGRTFVSGYVSDDVVALTLRTPRDVRTIRPAGGTFLAIYDGRFYGGEVVATARLRDGRTVTVRRPVS
ncbi:MAG TPA: hypothetical protein VI318_11935 [Baekduia sp.]